jgi:hypothetical protein
MSVYMSILTAVQTSAATIVPNTVIRRQPQIVKSDTFPLCVVSPLGEYIRDETFNKNVIYNYQVLVIYIAEGNRQLTEGLSGFMQARESLRDQLYQVFLPGTSIFDTMIEPEDAIKFQEYVGTNYDVTGFLMTYSNTEQRVS